MKTVSLCLLTIATSVSTTISKESRSVAPHLRYSATTATFLTEALKLVLSLLLAGWTRRSQRRPSPKEPRSDGLRESHILNKVWIYAIPSALYTLQNVLQLWSLSVLSPVAYQGLAQLKLPVAAGLSVMFLNRKLSSLQCLLIQTLLIGVLLVNTQGQSLRFASLSDAQPTVMLIMFLASLMGSTAGLFVEILLKREPDTSCVWRNNTRLSLCGMILPSAFILVDCYHQGTRYLFRGFGIYACLTVITRALGGMIVALVLRKTDSIAKAFATSFAIVLSLSVEVVTSQARPDMKDVAGAGLIVLSTTGYAWAAREGVPTLHV